MKKTNSNVRSARVPKSNSRLLRFRQKHQERAEEGRKVSFGNKKETGEIFLLKE
jgi:hypothetical protein